MFSTLNKHFGITKTALTNTASLMSSTLLSKLVFSVGGIFLANIYGPSDYGLYNVFLGYAGIFSVLFLFSSQRIILSSDSYKEIRTVFNGQLFLMFVLSLLACLLISGTIYAFAFPSGLSIPLLILAVFSGLFLSYISIYNAFYNKYAFYKVIAKGVVLFSVLVVAFQFLAYYLESKNGLIYAYLPALLLTVLFLAKHASKAYQKPDISKLKSIFIRYKDILTYSFPASVLFMLSQSVLPILILEYFGSKEAGEFSLAWKITMLPILIVSMSFNSIYSQKITKIYNGDRSQLLTYTLKVSLTNFGLLLVSLLLLNTVGIYLIDYTFQKEWAQLTEHFYLLSFFFFFRGLQVAVEQIFVVSQRNKQLLVFYILLLGGYFYAIYMGYRAGDFKTFILLFTLICGFLHALFFIYSLVLTHKLKKKQ